MRAPSPEWAKAFPWCWWGSEGEGTMTYLPQSSVHGAGRGGLGLTQACLTLMRQALCWALCGSLVVQSLESYRFYLERQMTCPKWLGTLMSISGLSSLFTCLPSAEITGVCLHQWLNSIYPSGMSLQWVQYREDPQSWEPRAQKSGRSISLDN